MASFVGLTVAVTLKQGGVIQGLVKSVDPATASLTLQDVYFPHTGQRVGNWTIQGAQIADLQVAESPTTPAAPTQYNLPSHSTIASVEAPIPVSVPQAQPEPFLDPAILSYERKPSAPGTFAPQRSHTLPLEAPSTPVKIIPPSAVDTLPQNNSSPFIGAPKELGKKKSLGRKKGKDAAATLKAPFSNLDINSAAEQEHLDDTDDPPTRSDTVRRVSITKTRTGKPMDDVAQPVEAAKKKSRKKKRDAPAQTGVDQNEADGEPSPEVTRKGNANGTYRGKGWRQTPILQDQPFTNSSRKLDAISGNIGQQGGSSSKLNKRQKALEMEAQNNGWATEDATDIQELPDFDFQENLSKFDKRSVFDQIRTEDTTADEDRLVSFNRTAARPGTYGGKNLHPTENVLESPKVAQRRASTQESDTDETFDFDNSRTTRRTLSRASSKRPPYRSGSGIADDNASLGGIPRGLRSKRGGGGYTGSISHGTTSSPNPARFTPPESPSISQTIQGAHFRIPTSNRACPTLMPAGMAAIEEIAEAEFGLSVEIMTENAGRGIAEVAMATLSSTSSRRATRENLRVDTRPWAVIFAGNHRAGARALAAARHLRGRNTRTLTCILGFDRQNVELDREVRKQAEILVKMGGVVRGWSDVRNYLKTEGQPELAIEALLSPGKPFDGLGIDDQRAVLEIVSWINKGAGGRVTTMSVDMPSGLNGSNGEAALIDGAEILQVRTDHVVCIGAPRVGLLRALQKASATITSAPTAATDPLHWQLWVVDIGVNRAWKQSGMASSKGVKFGSEWVVPLKLVDGPEDARS